MKQVTTKTVHNQKHCLYLHPSWKKHYKRGNRKRFPLLRLSNAEKLLPDFLRQTYSFWLTPIF